MRPFLPQSPLCRHPIALSEVQHLLDVVNQAVEHPLYVDFDPPPKRKSIKSLARSNIAEDRFYNAKPFAVSTSPLHRVDLILHGIC